MIRKASFLVALAAVTACTQTAPETATPRRLQLETTADSVISIGQRETSWGVEIWDQGRGRAVYSHNAERHFVPASNTKLVVTTVAMGTLGPDWRYQTQISFAGADPNRRTLVIKGSGDPTMSARFFGGDLAVLDSLADSLYVKGFRNFADVVIDATVFTPQKIHSAWEIGDLPWYYAAPTASFAVGEAAVRMIATPTDVRFVGPAPVANVKWQIRADTANASSNVDVDYERWPGILLVTGSVASNRADSSWIAQPDPETYAARALIDALRRKSVVVSGAERIVHDTAEIAALGPQQALFTWRSPPMKEIVGGILKPSQNWIAEQLLKTLGATRGTSGSWRGGLQVERRYLIDVVHIDSTAFSLSDGSGLSAQNLVTPHAFVQLLEHARKSPWGADYRAALPIPGLRGGTLSNRLLGLETRLAAKTGSIANVNSLSGYLRAADGRDITFSIQTNGSGRSSAEIRRAMDTIVRAAASEKNWD